MKEEIIKMVQNADNYAKLELIYRILQYPYDMELYEILYKLLQ